MNDEHERAQVARAGQDRPQAQQQPGQAERQAHTQRQDQRHDDQLARDARASQQRRGAQVHAPVSPDSGQAEKCWVDLNDEMKHKRMTTMTRKKMKFSHADA